MSVSTMEYFDEDGFWKNLYEKHIEPRMEKDGKHILIGTPPSRSGTEAMLAGRRMGKTTAVVEEYQKKYMEMLERRVSPPVRVSVPHNYDDHLEYTSRYWAQQNIGSVRMEEAKIVEVALDDGGPSLDEVKGAINQAYRDSLIHGKGYTHVIYDEAVDITPPRLKLDKFGNEIGE